MQDTTLQALVARADIIQRLAEYCRSMDRMDRALGKAVWHPDGTADYGDLFRGAGTDFIDWVCAAHAGMIGHSHQLGGICVQVAGDAAASEAYVTAVLRRAENGVVSDYEVRGRYLDRWSRRDGRWAIDHRQFVLDLDDVRPALASTGGPRGARDESDPSYALFASLD